LGTWPPVARATGDRLHRLVEGTLCRLFGHTAAKFKRIAIWGKVEFGIQRVKATCARLPVPGAAFPDRAEYRLDLAFLKPHPRLLDTVGTADGLSAPAGAAVVQMLLQQGAHQLPPSLFKFTFQFAEVHRTPLSEIKKIHDLFKARFWPAALMRQAVATLLIWRGTPPV
jgi:hypothetical protein